MKKVIMCESLFEFVGIMMRLVTDAERIEDFSKAWHHYHENKDVLNMSRELRGLTRDYIRATKKAFLNEKISKKHQEAIDAINKVFINMGGVNIK